MRRQVSAEIGGRVMELSHDAAANVGDQTAFEFVEDAFFQRLADIAIPIERGLAHMRNWREDVEGRATFRS